MVMSQSQVVFKLGQYHPQGHILLKLGVLMVEMEILLIPMILREVMVEN